ncbi:MAG: hypothetical protein ACRDZO_26780 [Egibacteraceae bacterium]
MNIATRARKSARRALVVGIATSMLAVAGPAHAGYKGGGGGGIKIDNDTAIAAGGDGGNGGLGVNIVALNCLLLLVDCGGGDFGGGNATGGAGGAANAQNIG